MKKLGEFGIKSETIGGDPVKQYFSVLELDGVLILKIDKLILTKENNLNKGWTLLRKYKDSSLFWYEFAIKIDTLAKATGMIDYFIQQK